MEDSLVDLSCGRFAEQLAAREPVPGGGGAAALAGALGAALCGMAGRFTAGKPRFADVEADVRRMIAEADDVRERLLELVDADADGFEPLMEAYALPRDTPGRADAIERETAGACMAPLAMMGECCRAIVLLEEMGEKCSRLLIADVASGALLTRAALEVASVNVYVNSAALKDRAQAEAIESVCSELLEEYVPRAERLALAMTDLIGGGGR